LKLTLIFNIALLSYTTVAPVGGAELLGVRRMIVCHFHRVSDRTIRAAIQAGAQCEMGVAERCGAGSSCGGCIPAVVELIQEERQPRRHLALVEAVNAA
jgi:bacterioferritin-associated ferredoxin